MSDRILSDFSADDNLAQPARCSHSSAAHTAPSAAASDAGRLHQRSPIMSRLEKALGSAASEVSTSMPKTKRSLFTSDNHNRVGAFHFSGEFCVLDSFTGIMRRQRQRRDVDELRLDSGSFPDFLSHEARGTLAHSARAHCAKYHRDK